MLVSLYGFKGLSVESVTARIGSSHFLARFVMQNWDAKFFQWPVNLETMFKSAQEMQIFSLLCLLKDADFIVLYDQVEFQLKLWDPLMNGLQLGLMEERRHWLALELVSVFANIYFFKYFDYTLEVGSHTWAVVDKSLLRECWCGFDL